MAHGEARAWWADVQHLRDDYERTAEARRRADEAELSTHRSAVAPARRSIVTPARRNVVAPARRNAIAPELHSAVTPARRSAAEPTRRSTGAEPARRTVEIRGRTVPAPSVPSARQLDEHRRHPMRPAAQGFGARPDRMALWALLMGVVLILVAVATADASSVAAVIVP